MTDPAQMECPDCSGNGTLICGQCNGSGEGMHDGSKCWRCKSRGWLDCPRCEGTGAVDAEDEE